MLERAFATAREQSFVGPRVVRVRELLVMVRVRVRVKVWVWVWVRARVRVRVRVSCARQRAPRHRRFAR